tara:strand:- start:566 stop:733 length:168 start_codon:yes stop_codon:yes gene_type:complete
LKAILLETNPEIGQRDEFDFHIEGEKVVHEDSTRIDILINRDIDLLFPIMINWRD